MEFLVEGWDRHGPITLLSLGCFGFGNERACRQFVHSLVNRVSRLISIAFTEVFLSVKRFLLILIKTAQ
jgi:hypothetical protein